MIIVTLNYMMISSFCCVGLIYVGTFSLSVITLFLDKRINKQSEGHFSTNEIELPLTGGDMAPYAGQGGSGATQHAL